jgi:RES domain-containing protein
VRSLWRISKHKDLEGLGGENTDGRWHTAARGKRIVYLSEHPALALIEVLANLKGNPKLFPDTYQLMKVNAADSVSEEVIEPDSLNNWRENGSETRSAGDSWLARTSSALLVVPSAASPESFNYLFNPLHPDAKGLTIEWSKWIEYDKRLFHTMD